MAGQVRSGAKRDFDRAGMCPPNGDSHPPDADGQRVTPERTLVQRLHRDSFVEAEVLQPASLTLLERAPVDAVDARTAADPELIEWKRELRGRSRHGHCCD
jgi:hypothetical protein